MALRTANHVSFDENDSDLVHINEIGAPSLKFKFDKVFKPDSIQDEVFDFVGKNIVDDALKGFNSTVLAYGQTGSGKTHTMYGAS